MLASVLVRFVCQITFGMAGAMLFTPASLVTSGYYRVHLWVLLGLNTFAALLAASLRSSMDGSYALVGVVSAAAILSYIGSVCWLYENPVWGRRVLVLTSLTGLLGCGALMRLGKQGTWLRLADDTTAGVLIGLTLAAMFLGHWYLNTPTMQLAPLKRLVVLMLVATVIRAILCGIGASFEIAALPTVSTSFWAILSLRWLSGLIGTCILAMMTWYTLKIPNTQSATGILYVAVICVFLGELTAQFLSSGTSFPL